MEMDKDSLIALLRGQPRHERIVTLRALYKMNQQALADVAEVARGTVSTWEREGKHEPSRRIRARLGTYFDLPPYVFSDEWGAGEKDLAQEERRQQRKAQRQANAKATYRKKKQNQAPEIVVPETRPIVPPVKRLE